MKKKYLIIFFLFINVVFADEWGDISISKDLTIDGELNIKGIIIIPSGITVIIKPGTILKFYKKDTDGDDVGESAIHVEGTLIARGEPENPIIFTSAEVNPKPGDWENIFFVVSEGEKNIVENCKIEYSYRGIHSHFSAIEIKNNELTNNIRGMQFQESVVKVSGNLFENNNSAMRFRDSEVIIYNNKFINNYYAISCFRSEVKIQKNIFEKNILESIHSRESNGIIEKNILQNNREGIYLKDSKFSIRENIINKNIENGLSVKFCSTTIIEKNVIEWNGSHGISTENTNATIINNNIINNGKYNVYLLGNIDISAKSNFWGGIDESYVKAKIYDFYYDSSVGKVKFDPFFKEKIKLDTTN